MNLTIQRVVAYLVSSLFIERSTKIIQFYLSFTSCKSWNYSIYSIPKQNSNLGPSGDSLLEFGNSALSHTQPSRLVILPIQMTRHKTIDKK